MTIIGRLKRLEEWMRQIIAGFAYQPNNPADWDPQPDTLASAIDQLADSIVSPAVFRFGNGPPGVDLGSPGDAYLDVDTGDFYWKV
jgi:hypothetical protein